MGYDILSGAGINVCAQSLKHLAFLRLIVFLSSLLAAFCSTEYAFASTLFVVNCATHQTLRHFLCISWSRSNNASSQIEKAFGIEELNALAMVLIVDTARTSAPVNCQ